MTEQLVPSPWHVQGGESAEVTRYLRNYTQLAASILQLAAWTCGESPATTQGGGADENNSNSANRDFSQHILSPSLAAVALQKGPAGVPPHCMLLTIAFRLLY